MIAAARTPQQKAPLLIDEESLRILPKGCVVVDLAISQGGNVVGSQRDQVMTTNGVSIVNDSGYPRLKPKEASGVYAKCLINLLAEVLRPTGELLLDHELLRECWVTHEGKRNSLLFEGF